jgi:hypothetical protein
VSKNYEGTNGGMEVACVLNILNCSFRTRGICYTKCLGDGNSKAYQRVVAGKPYGPNISVTKLECIGYVQKRMGATLRRLVKEMARTKLHDSKALGGKDCLTQPEIDKLQNYYGLAIRSNVNSLEAMKKAVWATFFHRLLTNENPQHGLCPSGDDIWCKFKNSASSGVAYEHKHSFQLLLWMQLNKCSGILLV